MNLGLREGAGLGEWEKERSKQFLLLALRRMGLQAQCWHRASLLREWDLEARGKSLPLQFISASWGVG